MNTLMIEDYLAEFKAIIKNKAVSTLFQPIISLKDGSILGYEALSRGPKNSPFYSPISLFNYAKQYNMLWELELACRLRALENASNKLSGKKLFINVDPKIIQDKKFKSGFTKKLLEKYDISPPNITFEITENTAVKDFKSLRMVLENYSKQGYNIALDDTGTGYSGLLLLAETHPNYIKIDMGLVRDIDKNKFKQDLMKVFYDFSKVTGVKIIAEGVETESELKTLVDIGVQYAQGYFIKKPCEEINDVREDIINLVKKFKYKKDIVHTDKSKVCIGYLARKDLPVQWNESIEKVDEIFSNKYTLQGITITKNKKPVGLIMRNKFYYQLLKRDKRTYGENPLVDLMVKLPLIVEYNTPLNKVIKSSMSRREGCTYDYIIVTKDGQYYGIVPFMSLLEALSKTDN